jgi:RsiW-degrading membrane proteinase PrsW (M82 family)
MNFNKYVVLLPSAIYYLFIFYFMEEDSKDVSYLLQRSLLVGPVEEY